MAHAERSATEMNKYSTIQTVDTRVNCLAVVASEPVWATASPAVLRVLVSISLARLRKLDAIRRADIFSKIQQRCQHPWAARRRPRERGNLSSSRVFDNGHISLNLLMPAAYLSSYLTKTLPGSIINCFICAYR